MDRKQLPVSISDFAKLITGNYYFVDKSLFIKELLDSGAEVTLIPRPRRFGKTINMSMIKCFFEKTETSNRHLFDGLNIEQYPKYMAKQGQYPVIFLTFKGVKVTSWAECWNKLKFTIATEINRHYGTISPHLRPQERIDCEDMIARRAEQFLYEEALASLSMYLYRAYGKRPLILIDEYDTPIHAAFDHNYYDEAVNFMRNFLLGGFKDNSNLEFGILTGILRVAKESIFSGLNNLRVCTLLEEAYSDKFGLLEQEVATALAYFGSANELSAVRAWYDGYQSGSYKIYNPWSIIGMLDNSDVMKLYWANSSDNAMLKQVLQHGPDGIKEDCEMMLRGGTITKAVDENVVMPELQVNEGAVWNLFLMSGYLTFENLRSVGRKRLVDLKIPNEEVYEIYDTQILSWFQTTKKSMQQYQSMLEFLLAGNRESFKQLFAQFAQETLGVFDVNGDNPERFYHGFVLGMLASLRDTHTVESNHESGWGRYDVCIFPKDITRPGIIFEFKVVHSKRGETLESEVKKALEQIEERQYEAAMRARGITNIIKIGISFDGKKNLVMFGS